VSNVALPRPPGYVAPPRATARALARTIAAASIAVPSIAIARVNEPIQPAPSTTTEAGLAWVQRRLAFLLRCLGVRLDVVGAERVPAQGGLIFMWNQASHIDHLVLAIAAPRPFFLVYNNAVAAFPLYGAHLRAHGHVHVDRGDEAQWRGAVAGAAARVRDGECVLVSPEGTRSWDGALLPMKRGAFLLAEQSGRPIVCMTVTGAHERLPRGAIAVRPGRIRIELSAPIAGAGRDRDAIVRDVVATFEDGMRAP
jgi:1-acyl-sn-glycerol-3-phosphate acyltransferase